MSDRTEYLATRLAQQRDETLALMRSLTPDQWSAVVHHDEDHWDVRTLLSHFISSEVSMIRLMEDIVAGGSGSPEDFDLQRFNASRANKMAEIPPADLLQQFEQTRAATIDYVRTLTDDQLDRQGRHASMGTQTVEGIFKIIYKHNQLHEIDIRRALGIPQPERRSRAV